jgi:hypothetical protein
MDLFKNFLFSEMLIHVYSAQHNNGYSFFLAEDWGTLGAQAYVTSQVIALFDEDPVYKGIFGAR